MQKDSLGEEYDLFYMELPQSDYFLTDIPIEDAYDDTDDENTNNKPRGLSDKQVSELADDQLGSQNADHQDEQNLFSDQDHNDR